MKLIVKDVDFIFLRLFNLPLNPYFGKVIKTVIVKSGQVVRSGNAEVAAWSAT